jgi:hypothetical protein
MEELLKLLETRNCELIPVYEHQTSIGLGIYSDLELDSDYVIFCDYKVTPWIIKGRYNVNPEKNINPEIGRNCEIENVRFEESGQTKHTQLHQRRLSLLLKSVLMIIILIQRTPLGMSKLKNIEL